MCKPRPRRYIRQVGHPQSVGGGRPKLPLPGRRSWCVGPCLGRACGLCAPNWFWTISIRFVRNDLRVPVGIRKDMTVPDSAWLLSRYVRCSWETKRTAQKETPEKCLKSRRAAIACGTLTFACAAELLNRGVRGPLRNRSSFRVQASRVTCARDRESVNCRSQGQCAIRRRRGAATTHPPRRMGRARDA